MLHPAIVDLKVGDYFAYAMDTKFDLSKDKLKIVNVKFAYKMLDSGKIEEVLNPLRIHREESLIVPFLEPTLQNPIVILSWEDIEKFHKIK